MLTVTAQAAAKLKEAIQAQTEDPELAIRLVPSAARSSQLDMALDSKKEGDQVVESEGFEVLFISAELTRALDGMVIDCQDTPQGAQFSIARLTPESE
jgi:Fe-S cluster assembly iron-binding protein IscA